MEYSQEQRARQDILSKDKDISLLSYGQNHFYLKLKSEKQASLLPCSLLDQFCHDIKMQCNNKKQQWDIIKKIILRFFDRSNYTSKQKPQYN